MPVELQVIQERLKKSKHQQEIKTAREQEERIRFHCLPAVEASDFTRSKARRDHLLWVSSLINKKKVPKYDTLLRNPHENISVANEMFTSLFRVFDGVNSVRRYNFVKPESEQAHEAFRMENNFYEKLVNLFQEALRGYHNSFLVIDMPEDSTLPPLPYLWLLTTDEVHDYDFVDARTSDQLEWAMFYMPKNQIGVYDDEQYRVFQLSKDDKTKIEGGPIVANSHDLGQCPVSYFIGNPVNRKRISIKRSILTDHLSALEWNLFFHTSKKHVDTYAPWPIMSAYKEACRYSWDDPVSDRRKYCENGFLRDEHGRWIERTVGELEPCPACSKNDLSGAGTFLKVPPPDKRNNFADLRDPVQVTVVPTPNLEQVTKEADRLRAKLISDVTGSHGAIINNQAINLDQVFAFMQQQTAILMQLKKPLEKAEKWVTDIMCKLMFGLDYLGCYIDYGNEWILAPAEHLLTIYTAAKDAGWSSSMLDDLQDRYYVNKYRNSPEDLARANMIKYIEPFRHLSNEEAKGLYDLNKDLYQEYFLKVNFTSLLNRFELENVAITRFDIESPLPKRVEKIRNALLSYIQPIDPEAATPAPQEQGAPAPSEA